MVFVLEALEAGDELGGAGWRGGEVHRKREVENRMTSDETSSRAEGQITVSCKRSATLILHSRGEAATSRHSVQALSSRSGFSSHSGQRGNKNCESSSSSSSK